MKPRNVGVLDGDPGVGRGEAINDACGDTVVFTVRVVDGAVAEARFQSKGCAGAIAACSVATELVTGRAADGATVLSPDEVAAALEGLPAAKMGCAEMAANAACDAVRAASTS